MIEILPDDSMTMEKLNFRKSGNPLQDTVQENIEKIRSVLPEVFRDHQIDFDALKDALGGEIGNCKTQEERYRFTWHGKAEARHIVQTPSVATLRPVREDSLNWESTENLFIEGDNLEVLKLLQKSFHKKVKMIYIDPPYNTGKEFIYPDNYRDTLATYLQYSGQTARSVQRGNKRREGDEFGVNSELAGRFHTNWLNMIYPRLKLARNLLQDDGVIFISIDDNEVANLRKVCDEIFGEENFRNCFAVRRHDKNLNRQFIERGLHSLNVGFEYVLAYAKSSKFTFFPVYRTTSEQRQSTGYWKGFWNAPDRPTMRYDILGFTPNEGQWKWKKEVAYRAVENYHLYLEKFSSKLSLEAYWEKSGKKLKFIRRNPQGRGKNKGVEHWIPPSQGILRNTSLLDILASRQPRDIQGIFDFPKSRELMEVLCSLAMDKDDLAMDFFCGSATTAHALLSLNARDGGRRRYIMVQLPEPCGEKSHAFKAGFKTIADIGRERIRRAGVRLLEEIKEKQPRHGSSKGEGIKTAPAFDTGFKFFQLDTSNFRAWDDHVHGNDHGLEQCLWQSVDQVKSHRTHHDLLYEILLKYGFDPALLVEEITIAGKRFFVADSGSLVLCLEPEISLKVVQGIGKLKKERKLSVMGVVFRDSGFVDDVAKINAVEMLKQYCIEDIKCF